MIMMDIGRVILNKTILGDLEEIAAEEEIEVIVSVPSCYSLCEKETPESEQLYSIVTALINVTAYPLEEGLQYFVQLAGNNYAVGETEDILYGMLEVDVLRNNIGKLIYLEGTLRAISPEQLAIENPPAYVLEIKSIKTFDVPEKKELV